MDNRIKWSYKGPVYLFGKYVGDIEASTLAISKARAISNICFQAKSTLGRPAWSRVEIDPSKIKNN